MIGGAQIFSEALCHKELNTVYLTQIEADFDCDVFFPEQPALELLQSSAPKIEGELCFRYQTFKTQGNAVKANAAP